MFALNERAKLYKHAGQHAGKPAYADAYSAFPCRTQPEARHTPGSKGIERSADTRVFMPASAATLAIEPGDKIVLDDGAALIVAEVQIMRGFSGVHHLEVLANRAGD